MRELVILRAGREGVSSTSRDPSQFGHEASYMVTDKVSTKCRGRLPTRAATFDSGKPCINGHNSPRYLATNRCVECWLEKASDRYSQNREAELQKMQARYRANPAKVKKRVKEWCSKNKDKTRQYSKEFTKRHPEARAIAKHKWYEANKAKSFAWSAARRARVRNARVGGCRKAYEAFLQWSMEAVSIPCYWCGKKTKPKDRHRDHIIPISRGGVDSVDNLCVACRRCNLSKHNRLPEEFTGQSELRLA